MAHLNKRLNPFEVQKEGSRAYKDGKQETDNPYTSDRLRSGYWLYGFRFAKQKAETFKPL